MLAAVGQEATPVEDMSSVDRTTCFATTTGQLFWKVSGKAWIEGCKAVQLLSISQSLILPNPLKLMSVWWQQQ